MKRLSDDEIMEEMESYALSHQTHIQVLFFYIYITALTRIIYRTFRGKKIRIDVLLCNTIIWLDITFALHNILPE